MASQTQQQNSAKFAEPEYLATRLFFPDVRGPSISGLSALFLLIFATAVVVLAWWAGQPGPDAGEGRSIQGLYGFMVAVGLAVLILCYAWVHNLSGSVAMPRSGIADRIGRLAAPFGDGFTLVDHALVFWIANLCGAGEGNPGTRATQFVGYFGAAIVLCVILPAPWGLLPAFAALLGVVGLNRKWAWVEEDRRSYVLSGAYRVRNKSNLNVGFAGDYRGIALSSLALLIIVMPLALMQASAFGFFGLKNGGDIAKVALQEWFIFFGGEMAKSVPFVDWSEVYGAQTVTPLVVNPGGGQHAVFFVRAVVDLVLLSGFIQVLDLSGRLARQEANFREPENPERILDPFLERDACRDIAKWVAPSKLTELDTGLLARLKPTLGPFTRYSNRQIQRVLMSGEAPPYWLPDHESGMAVMLPHRENNNAEAPKFFKRIIAEGCVAEPFGAQPPTRPVFEQTRAAAAISSLAAQQAGFADVRQLSLELLPRFIVSSETRVWSGAICVLAEVRSDLKFPTGDAAGYFAKAFADRGYEHWLPRCKLSHQALAHLANAKRPSGDGEPRPHLDWAAGMLAKQLEDFNSLHALSSAVSALATIEFREGATLNFAQKRLGDLEHSLRPGSWSWRRLLPIAHADRVRRAVGECSAQISRYER